MQTLFASTWPAIPNDVISVPAAWFPQHSKRPIPVAGDNALPRATATQWAVYIIEASDNSLYTGISTDPERRLREHRSGRRGARFFRGREPRALRYIESGHSRSSACCREAEIKRWPRERKIALICGATANNTDGCADSGQQLLP